VPPDYLSPPSNASLVLPAEVMGWVLLDTTAKQKKQGAAARTAPCHRDDIGSSMPLPNKPVSEEGNLSNKDTSRNTRIYEADAATGWHLERDIFGTQQTAYSG
jgi:hypothetical protein